MGIKRKNLWTVIAVILAVLTIWAVFSRSGDMSLSELAATLKDADPVWLLTAVLGMLGIIFFEGEAILVILKRINYPRSHRQGFLFGAADVYFSAITPSASGGQPASAFFMIRSGIPGAFVTAVLILNLVMYTLAIVGIGTVCILLRPSFFLRFSTLSKVLIVSGYLALSGLAVLFFFLLYEQAILFGTGRKLIRFLSSHRLMRHPDKYLKKLERQQEEYSSCVRLITGHFPMLAAAYVCNLLQRLSQFLVILSVYMATGGSFRMLGDLFITQCYIILGSNCVPVPGGMGVTDYLMLDGYGQLFDKAYSFKLEILGRSLSFYVCILVSALTVLAGYLSLRRKTRKSGKSV